MRWPRWRQFLRWAAGCAAGLVLLGLCVYGWLRWPSALPGANAAPPPAGTGVAWWTNPPELSEQEVAFQRWLAAVTCDLPRERWSEHWNVGGGQYGVSSIRYQAAFAGYAAAVLGMRTPAYPALTQRILESAIEHLTDRSAWLYVSRYWPDKPWYPDPCASENIMYTGHLLQLMALHEALSGDCRYRTAGVTLVWDEKTVFHYTLTTLAEVTVRQMRENPCGGVACEPSLVFFPCNNHPQIALLLMQGLGLGDWSAERNRWETWALSSYRAPLGGGAISLLYHQDSKVFVPRGHPGLDGWSLLWYLPWASNPDVPARIWQSAKKHIDAHAYATAEPAEVARLEHGESSCCDPVQVPASAVASFLAPAARACGDPGTAEHLERWLDRHFLRQADGRAWLDTSPEWRIGVTANRALAAALANGSDLRALVQRPLPRDYLQGPRVTRVTPPTVAVHGAHRQGADLILSLDAQGQETRIELANVGAVRRVDGIGPGTWRDDGQGIVLAPTGRVTLRVVTEPASAPGATP
jgi:hypothetical protein